MIKIRTVQFAGTLMDPGSELPGDLPQIAFSGRSNVGKSSLINTILGRTRKRIAHVSGTPGKTQGLNFFRVNEDFFLVDLPGFGFARVPDHVRQGWKPLVEGYLARVDGPRAVVHLVDSRRSLSEDDQRMLGYLAVLQLPTLVAVTKIDKLSWEKRTKALPALIQSMGLDPEQIIPFSSKTGEGRLELLGALADLLSVQRIPVSNQDRS